MFKKLTILIGLFAQGRAWSAGRSIIQRGRPTSLQMSTLPPKNAKFDSVSTIRNVIRFSSAAAACTLFLVGTATSPAFAEEPAAVTATASDKEVEYITTESGLKYRDLKVGDGDAPVPGDIVRVHYTGWLDGFDSDKKFDSSYDRRSPLSFPVGARKVIAGWDEGILTNLKVGGKRELVIPAALGYGSRGAGGVIPPNATLYFRIELVGIGAKPNR